MLHRKTLWFITFLLLSLFVNALIGQENTSESVEHQPAEEGDSSEAQNKQAPSEYFKNIETGDDGVSMTIIFAKVRKEVDIDALYYDLNLPPQSPMIMDDAVI
ncbi:hypothetical protein JW877_06250, partial [bacterium]|nr:hypothetical protein [bacterium]